MTSAENRQHARNDKVWQVTLPAANPNRTLLALLRVGTRRCRLAAAFMAIVIILTAPIANGAFAETRRTVLYLDAPTVSKNRALRAGEVADAYTDLGSPATRETLAWLGLPVLPTDVSTPPEYAEDAFASLTAPNGAVAGGVTADAAFRAGEVMLAQIDEGVPRESRDGDEDMSEEMAAAGAVRPRLGDGTRAPDAEHVAEPATQSDEQPEPGGGEVPTDVGTLEYASTPAYPDPTGEPAEPSAGASIVVPAPLSGGGEPEEPSTELAAAPSYKDTSPEPAFGTEDEPYRSTGPVSDVGESTQQPYSDENNLAAEQDEFAQADPVEEEPAEADTPVATLSEPASPDMGPTGEERDEVALVPVSIQPEESEDPTQAPSPASFPAGSESDDFASAQPSPAAEEAPQESFEQAEIVIEGGEPPADASPRVTSSEGRSEVESIGESQVYEVTIVQESQTGAAVEGTPADESGDEADGPEGSDTVEGTGQEWGQTTHEPSAGESGDPTDHPAQANMQPSPEKSASSTIPTTGGPSETADQPGNEVRVTESGPAEGGRTLPADETGTRRGDPQGELPQGEATPARTPNDPTGDDSSPRHYPNGGDTRDPCRHDHGASNHPYAGNRRPASPIGRGTKEADGDQVMREGAQDPVDLPEGGGTPSPAVREARPEESAASQSLQRGSRGAPRGTDLRMLQNPLDSTRRGGSGPTRTPHGTGRSERALAGAGQGDTEEDIQQGSPEPRMSARQTAEAQTYTQPESINRVADQ